MDWLIVLVVGALVGWIASMIMKTDAQMGAIANILVGIVGSALGFWIAGAMGIGGGNIVRFLIALGGAMLLIFLLQALGVFGGRRKV